jgi:broad specificity phosphatase PhoE
MPERRVVAVTARLILICHGSTAAVRSASFPADEPLDDHGKVDAAALAGRLPDAERWLTAPESRARQTAEMLGLDAAVDPALRDCDYGAWRGRSFDDVHAREPDAVAIWLAEPAAAPHGGESILALLARVAGWLGDEQRRHARTIAVTHSAVIRAAILSAIGAPPQSFWRIDLAPLSVTRLSGAAGRWNLSSIGCAQRRGEL